MSEWKDAKGNSFMAVTVGLYGEWEKATDPITALRAVRDSGKEVIAYVVYGDVWCSEFGGYCWDIGNPPMPIGKFTIGKRGIIKATEDCAEWIAEHTAQIDAQEERERKTA